MADEEMRGRKMIKALDEHEEHPGQSLATKSHEVIQKWAEERQAEPATLPGSEHAGHPGVLRFDFPGYGGQSLEKISWDDWFRAFDERDLTFIYQEHLKNGNLSNFFLFDNPNREEG